MVENKRKKKYSPEQTAIVGKRGLTVLEAYRAKSQASREEERQQRLAEIRAKLSKQDASRKLSRLPASSFFYDERYQRPLNDDFAFKIAFNFDWEKFGVILINVRRDGTLACVDGRHRVAAAQLVMDDNDVVLDCYCIHVATWQEEAEIFYHVNQDRQAQSYLGKFRARLAYGEENARHVQAIVSEIGMCLQLSPSKKQSALGEIGAIATVERICTTAGPTAGREVLGLLHDAYGNDPNGYRQPMLEGVYDFLMRYFDTYERGRLVSVLKTVGSPSTVLTMAHEFNGGKTMLSGQSVSQALHRLYNHGRRVNRLTDFLLDTGRNSQHIRNAATRYQAAHDPQPETIPA